jgi:hypothetical protein
VKGVNRPAGIYVSFSKSLEFVIGKTNNKLSLFAVVGTGENQSHLAARRQARFHITQVFYGIFRAQLPAESRLTRCELFRQTAFMEAELDCGLQSNSR